LKILALLLICIPNGALHRIYGNEICGGSKNKNEAFRYKYKQNPVFQLLETKPFRFKILHVDKNTDIKNIIGFNFNEK